jgi:nucleotide-binding universal stress UspA family protein
MFKHVLVGIDGGPGGRDAIALAQRLVEPDGRITLGNVYGSVFSLLPPAVTWNEQEVLESRERLRIEREALATDGHPPVDVVSMPSESVGGGLHQLAGRTGADLIVVGGAHRGPVGRLFSGDDARDALEGAPCAVATAPKGYREHDRALARVGVGYDGSLQSEAALTAARELAERTGGAIEALVVVEMPVGLTPGPWDDVVDGILDEASQRLEGLQGVKTSTVWGNAGQALRALSERVDVLLLGTRRYGPIEHLMLGTTSAYVQRHAHCPTIVLPERAATSPARETAPAGQVTSPT